MKAILMLLLVSASVTASCQSSVSNQPFTLSISTDETVVKDSSTISIRIIKTNITNQEINKRNEPATIYDIRDSSGNEPERHKDYHYQGNRVAMLIGTKDWCCNQAKSEKMMRILVVGVT